MTQLKAVANRIFVRTDPYVKRYPVFEPGVFYQTGSVVSRSFQVNDSDSDIVYYNFYVAQRDIQPLGLNPEQTGSDWVLWISGDPKFATFWNDSDVYAYIDKADETYQTKFTDVDSDLRDVRDEVNVLLGFDSEIKAIQHDIRALEERNLIDSLIDSEASEGRAISWDSDNQKFKFITPVLSINNVLPDANGNVSYTFTQTKTGTRNDRLDSDQNGTIFIVVGDSDSDQNGTTYSFTDIGWVRLIGFTEKENEIRYVDVTGDSMTGPLYLAGNPTSDSEAATKSYVDNFNDSDKQDKIIILATQSDLAAATKQEGRIYFVKADNTVWLYDSATLKQFIIPGERIFDPVLLEARAVNKTVTFFDIDVKTYRFSDKLGGTLSLYRNGSSVATAFALNTNINGTYNLSSQVENARLFNASNQSFRIRVPIVFQTVDTYRLDFYSHDGVFTSITIDGANNKVAFSESNRIFNFGEY